MEDWRCSGVCLLDYVPVNLRIRVLFDRMRGLACCLVWWAASASAALLADERAICADMERFFLEEDADRREEIARGIEADPAYNRAKVRDWLHRAGFFEPMDPGRVCIRVSLDDGGALPVTIRVPRGYDPRRPYPLIYALHGTAGTGDAIIDYAERLLGDEAEQFVVAAPTGYQQVVIHASTPPSSEHMAVLQAIRRSVHIRADRIYALGYSRGGHAAWTLAVVHPGEFAGILPIAGTLILPDPDALFEVFVPNIASTRVFTCWGENDIMSADYATPSQHGGIAGLNRRVCTLAAGLNLPITWFEVPDKGHEYIEPPREDLRALLSMERQAYPPRFLHVFRFACQGYTPWIEPHAWRGPWWEAKPLQLSFRDDENPSDPATQRAALTRAVRGRLGELRGEINGQIIRVYRKKISELTVWIGDGMIDWDQPAILNVNGRVAFEGKLAPDLAVCLTQAARTYDFDRLRWAGLRFKSGSRTRVITSQTPFPRPPAIPE